MRIKKKKKSWVLRVFFCLSVIAFLFSFGCDADSDEETEEDPECEEGMSRCQGDIFELCTVGKWWPWKDCTALNGGTCETADGTSTCEPGATPDDDGGLGGDV